MYIATDMKSCVNVFDLSMHWDTPQVIVITFPGSFIKAPLAMNLMHFKNEWACSMRVHVM